MIYLHHLYSQNCLEQKSVDPDQTAPEEQSDQGLHCLLIVTLTSPVKTNELV